ncbi:MAG TPA: hypothetical protein DCM08_05465 [Microscillaceae bacterium]|jgi:DNA repair protein RadC|nr:hypothetical protein [Microscillaceae bacterium]
MEENELPKSLRITDWAEDDRPREKLLRLGAKAVSDAELIAILLGSGTKSMTAVDVAKLLLSNVNNDLHELARKGVADLRKFKGIGEARAITIVAALELSRRRDAQKAEEKFAIKSAEDVYVLMKQELMDLPNEEFWIILLNRANRVLKIDRISSGGVSGTVVDAKDIFYKAITYHQRVSGIILVHNHPSGNLKPSQADIDLTRRIKEAGKILEISVLDHLIFANQGYFSFAQEGLVF